MGSVLLRKWILALGAKTVFSIWVFQTFWHLFPTGLRSRQHFPFFSQSPAFPPFLSVGFAFAVVALSRFYFLLMHFTSHPDSDLPKGAALLLLGLSWDLRCSLTHRGTNSRHVMGIHRAYQNERCQGLGWCLVFVNWLGKSHRRW